MVGELFLCKLYGQRLRLIGFWLWIFWRGERLGGRGYFVGSYVVEQMMG